VVNHLADDTRVLEVMGKKSNNSQSKQIEGFPTVSGDLCACSKVGGSYAVAWKVATLADVGATPNCDSFAQFFRHNELFF